MKILILLLMLFAPMVSEQLKIYIDNHDVSSLLYKKFKGHHQDTYPTFSICVVLYDGALFEESLRNSSKPYWNFIRGYGKRDDYKQNFSYINYDEALMDISKMLQKYQRKAKRKDGKSTTQKFLELTVSR